MELSTIKVSDAVPAYSLLQGIEDFELPAGKSLRIRTVPNGVEYLDVGPAEGKVWLVTMRVQVREEEAEG